jgi:hypothetical protein
MHPAPHCSAKYSMLPTIDAIKALSTAGFVPVSARQDASGGTEWDTESHSRHIVRLRPLGMEDTPAAKMKLGVVPEIIIVNASDASTRFAMDVGLHRLVCSNGLVAFTVDSRISTVHKHTTIQEVVVRAEAMVKTYRPLLDQVQRWSKLTLTDKQVTTFAKKALTLRGLSEEYDPASLLVVQRKEDEGTALWTVFNRVQENAMRGNAYGVRLREDGRQQALISRPLSGIAREIEFNKALWALAEEFEGK